MEERKKAKLKKFKRGGRSRKHSPERESECPEDVEWQALASEAHTNRGLPRYL